MDGNLHRERLLFVLKHVNLQFNRRFKQQFLGYNIFSYRTQQMH